MVGFMVIGERQAGLVANIKWNNSGQCSIVEDPYHVNNGGM